MVSSGKNAGCDYGDWLGKLKRPPESCRARGRVGTCVMSTAGFAVRGNDVLGAWETTNQIRVAALSGILH